MPITEEQLLAEAKRRGIDTSKYTQTSPKTTPTPTIDPVRKAVGDILGGAYAGWNGQELPKPDNSVNNILLREQLMRDRPVQERPVDAARREKLEKEAALLDKYLGVGANKNGGPEGGQDFPPGTTLRAGPYTIPVNREYTEGESTKLSNAESMGGQISKLRELVQKDQRGEGGMLGIQGKGSLPFGLGNPDAQRFKIVKNDLVDRLVRMRSGAQINKQEFDRLSALLPSVFRDDGVDLEQLAVFDQEMNAIEGRISQGAGYIPNTQPDENNDPLGIL